ncbi:MAG: HD domain-containing protein, partial [Bacteroidales bacterium]|nr:HD domain-containing protein [Bacteroidales bacterium]
SDYIQKLFDEATGKGYIYHNVTHTREVVKAVQALSEHSNLPQEDANMVLIAAWFHDIGYVNSYNDHEEESKKMADEFLQSKGMNKEIIQIITNCIDATKVPQKPKTLLEEILCDADMFHLSQPEFCDKTELLRLEQNTFRKKTGKKKFLNTSLKFLNLPYFTGFAQKNWTTGKEKNIKKIMEKLSGQEVPGFNEKGSAPVNQKKITKLKNENKTVKKKLDKQGIQVRGVETMFRNTARSQINLSAIADNKSNILITVNSLLISVIITFLVRRYYEMPHIVVPSVIFLLTCLISMIFAILSTRPKVAYGKYNREDIKRKKINLLFFGNFFDMPFDDYEWGIEELMKDSKSLYRTMILNQYELGKVLARKYKLIRIAYSIFLYGFILTMLSFGLALIIYA